MTAVIRCYVQGSPSVMVAEKEAVGFPGYEEVRIRQEAIGVNFVDALVCGGAFKMPVPFVPGVEGAGVVEAIGPRVAGVSIGDRVGYFYAPGSYAAVRLINADALVPLPTDISFSQSAAMLTKGLTAWMVVRVLYPIEPGTMVLVQGASGGVGSMVAKWAKALGAIVIGTTGTASRLAPLAEMVDIALLADAPNARERIRQIAPRGVDFVCELVGRATFSLSVDSVRDGGTILAIGAASGPPDIDKPQLTKRTVTLTGGNIAQFVQGRAISTATSELFDAYRNGLLGTIAMRTYPLEQAAQAHVDIEMRTRAGIPVLIP